jgi:Permuted papain-like amidase enzyme, YaeF/YiiX, C92 family
MKISKPIIIFSLICLVLNCSGEISRVELKKFKQEFNRIEQQRLILSIQHFQKLVEWALVLRKNTIAFAQAIHAKHEDNIPITGEDVDILQQGIQRHLLLRKEILKIIYTFQPYNIKYDLLDKDLRLTYDMFSLAGALVLHDNFATAIITFQNDSKLRRLANRGDRGFNLAAGKLEEVLINYQSSENRKKMLKIIARIKANRTWIDQTKKENEHLAYLDNLILQSPSLQAIKKRNTIKKYSAYWGALKAHSEDKLRKFNESTLNEVSKVFGNSVGLIQTRRGHLYKNKAVAKELENTLKPLDVLLDQTPFRLTAKFIPGHFGHVAIWTGSPEELKTLGLWEHPKIKPYQKDIIDGKRIIEALRDGVQLNTIEHFMDVDDIVILRLAQPINKQEQQATAIRAFRQLEKEYDFNFDVETSDKIVCSELAYMVFTHVKWPTEKTLGRNTISPDNVAYLATEKNHPFKLIKFYHKGKDMRSNALKTYKKVLVDNGK